MKGYRIQYCAVQRLAADAQLMFVCFHVKVIGWSRIGRCGEIVAFGRHVKVLISRRSREKIERPFVIGLPCTYLPAAIGMNMT